MRVVRRICSAEIPASVRERQGETPGGIPCRAPIRVGPMAAYTRYAEADGESAAAELSARLDAQAEVARELCYRLYTLCERKKRAAEALTYNALVQSWPKIARIAREQRGQDRSISPQGELI
jgi:hypothetical protein